MMATNSPDEYFAKLGDAEKEVINNWTQRRQMLMQSMVSKSIEDSMKDHASSERKSSSYIKVLAKAFCRSKKQVTADKQKQLAELTIWRVTEEQLYLIKEGTVVRIKELGVKSDRGGLLQLSANAKTVMESLPSEPTQYQLIQSGYEERSPKSLIRINLMSKKLEPSRISREVDVVACIVKIHKLDDHTSVAYLTDESGFVMKLMRNHGSQNNDPFHLGNVEAATSLPVVVAFCNIQVTSFDSVDQCATGAWSLLSCKAKQMTQLRCDELQAWSTSLTGIEDCRTILDRINAGISICAGPFNRNRVCIGYILGVAVCDDVKDADSNELEVNVTVDYGEELPLLARLQFQLLLDAMSLCQSNHLTTQSVEQTQYSTANNAFNHIDLLPKLSALDGYFQDNQTLLRFSLETASCYGNELPIPVVTGVYCASMDAMSRLHLS